MALYRAVKKLCSITRHSSEQDHIRFKTKRSVVTRGTDQNKRHSGNAA